MKIDVVIPNYNGTNLIKKNLKKVLEIFPKDVNAIIVDDASDSGQVKELKKFINDLKSNRVKVLYEEKNMGFSSTANKGAFSSNADFIFFLNSDAIPESNFLQVLIKSFDKDKNLFGVGCLDKSVEKEGVVLRGRGLGSWKRGFLIHSKGEVDSSDTFWISGGSSIMRKEIFDKIGGFDTLFNPFYWEDIDLSYRAQKAGYRIGFEKEAAVIHYHEEGAIKKHFSSSEVKKIAYRNQFIFIWKNVTDPDLLLSHIGWLPYHFLKALLRLDLEFFSGFIIALLTLPAIIDKRQKQRKLFVKTDKEIINSVK